MSVYVDDMEAPYRGMVMCHMLADSTAELLAMADRIGVARRWLQRPGTPGEHFDICKAKRALAVRCGAREITWREAGEIVLRRAKATAAKLAAGHPRVVNVRQKGRTFDAYVGRGSCPCGAGTECGHRGRFGEYGNPFDVRTYGDDAMVFFFAWLAGERDGPGVKALQGPVLFEAVRVELRGLVLACWCAPKLCHAEAYARLADGEPLEAIRADMLARVSPQAELFGDTREVQRGHAG